MIFSTFSNRIKPEILRFSKEAAREWTKTSEKRAREERWEWRTKAMCNSLVILVSV